MTPLTHILPLTPETTGNATLRNAQIAARRAQDTAMLAAKAGNTDKIDKAAKDFEAVFATEMMKPMFKDIGTGEGPFGGGKGEKIFSGMMLNEYGKQIAERDGLGIAGEVKAQLLRLQEAKTHGHG
jgi:Rod binding domain-containing protein